MTSAEPAAATSSTTGTKATPSSYGTIDPDIYVAAGSNGPDNGAVVVVNDNDVPDSKTTTEDGVAQSETTPLINQSNHDHNQNGNGDCCHAEEENGEEQQQHKDPPSWVSRLIFHWFTPILHRGNEKNRLDQDDLDLVPLPDDCQTEAIMQLFDRYWTATTNEQQQAQKSAAGDNDDNNKKGNSSSSSSSLIRALYLAFGREFLEAGGLKLIHDLNVFVGPQVLHAVIQYLRMPNASLQYGLSLVVAVTASQLTMSLCLRHYFFKCYKTGLRVRTATVLSVYRKALHLSPTERQTRRLGEITNLSSIDAQRLQELMNYFHALWYSPLQISLALYFLWQQLGASSLGGVLVIVLMIPVTKSIAQWMASMQKQLMTAKDARVELNTEVLAGTKVIKLQAWEEAFQTRILALRQVELDQLWAYGIGTAWSGMLWTFTPLAVALATFAAYVLSGQELDVASALTALALFQILRFPLFMLPRIVNSTVEAMVSVGRIESFLRCQDHKPVPFLTDLFPTDDVNDSRGGGVKMQTVTAAYETNKTKVATVVLDDHNLNANKKDPLKDPLLKELVEKDWEIRLLQSQLREYEQRLQQLAKQSTTMTTATTSSSSRTMTQNKKTMRATNTHSADTESLASLDNLTVPCENDDEDHDDHPQEENDKQKSGASDVSESLVENQLETGSTNNGGGADLNLLCLKRVDFECKPGHLVAVVGGVGCGKSSFINAILGEVRQLSGTTAIQGNKLAYFSQNPYIMNATVRDNILFGHVNDNPIDEELYQKAIDCCALKHDLELLSDGDMTDIGEKGVTLSGGQKARVALARAVYHQADITLIDDALAAVDSHVAVQLFQEAIVGELMRSSSSSKDKRSVILVTNAIQYLNHKRVDKIVVIDDGRIVEEGTYSELAGKKDSVFSRFLKVVNETGVSAGEMDSSPTLPEAAPSQLATKDRETSVTKLKTSEPADSSKPVKRLMTEEVRQVGHVSWSVYIAWFKAAGGFFVPVIFVMIFTLSEGMSVLSNWWLTYWSAHGAGSESQLKFLAIYALINFSTAGVGFVRMIMTTLIGLTASKKLFEGMLAVILHAPMVFFDTTPVGRLINRFSKDMYTVDETLMETLAAYLSTLFSVLSTIFVIAGVSPVFVLFMLPMISFYIHEQAFFTISYRELKRLDSSSRSPLYALLGESVDGASVIRSFGAEDSLIRRMTLMMDFQQHAYYLTCAAQSWLALRLELIGTLIITFATLSGVLGHQAANGDETLIGLAGLAISYSLQTTQSLNWSVRMASDMEAAMVSVERVIEYSQVPCEGVRHSPIDEKLPKVWPVEGQIDIVGAKLRYREGLPLVLKGLTLHIPGGSKVGVVGRTGAGKSTLMLAMLRIVELAEGQIFIDGQDIREVGLAVLRSNIAVIPQDPTLYSGTVRDNLDPFNDYTEDKLYEVLDRVGLYALPMSSSAHSSQPKNTRIESLSDSVLEGGANFSVGQRQLLVIARALLHGSKVIIMDEATAAVDAETDAVIQKVMRIEFKHATVITVAHRINTIMDSDFILVMSDGIAAEFDAPSTLLKKGGLFRELVEAASQGTGII